MIVSIIIPCYNGEATVAEAVESALAQTYPYCEIVAVDDGSSDGSLDELHRFGDRIKLLSVPNQGGAAARNRGVAAAAGTFIQFLDADDLLLPEKVALCVDAALDLPEHTIPVTDWSRRLLEGERPDEQNTFPAEQEDILAATLSNGLAIETPLHRRAAFEAVGGFRECLRCCQEKDLHLRLVAAGHRFRRIPVEGVIVRQTAGSVSSNNEKVLLQHVAVLESLMEEVTLRGRLDASSATAIASALRRDGFDLSGYGHLSASRKAFALAERLRPSPSDRLANAGPVVAHMVRTLGFDAGTFLYTMLNKVRRKSRHRNRTPSKVPGPRLPTSPASNRTAK